ncbi:MAG: phosphoadenylyl-sulfate reductase [Candidatus Bathyarchaeota archaeon]
MVEKFSDKDLEKIETKNSVEILKWTIEKHHPRIALASSFGAEDIVVIDQMLKINPEARIFTLDTGRLHQETYDAMDAVRKKYGINIKVFFPETGTVEEMVKKHGLNLFYNRVELRCLCCDVRKVEPLNRAISNLDAWITGLRREQFSTRTSISKVAIDHAHGGILKINPLADWTWDMVLRYVKDNKLPYNRLHDLGYPSIGCAPCTRPVKPGEDWRAGRWWWEKGDAKECGLHHRVEGDKSG